MSSTSSASGSRHRKATSFFEADECGRRPQGNQAERDARAVLRIEQLVERADTALRNADHDFEQRDTLSDATTATVYTCTADVDSKLLQQAWAVMPSEIATLCSARSKPHVFFFVFVFFFLVSAC